MGIFANIRIGGGKTLFVNSSLHTHRDCVVSAAEDLYGTLAHYGIGHSARVLPLLCNGCISVIISTKIQCDTLDIYTRTI